MKFLKREGFLETEKRPPCGLLGLNGLQKNQLIAMFQ